MSVLSKGGRSGRLSAWTWLVWFARAAATAASVAIRDCLSRSSLSCCSAILTAFAVMRSMSAASMVLADVVGGLGGAASGPKKLLFSADVEFGEGVGDLLAASSRMRA